MTAYTHAQKTQSTSTGSSIGAGISRRGLLRFVLGAVAILPLLGSGACGVPEDEELYDTEDRQQEVGSPMLIGAAVNLPDSSIASWKAASTTHGPWRVRRSFNKNLPSHIKDSAAADDAKNGVITFLSVKPPKKERVVKGDYDSAIRSLARSFPTDHTTYLTMYHEPENDMDGPTFQKMFRHFYKLVKAENPKIKVGTVHMSYQWRPGSPTTAKPDEWWVGSAYTDFIGVDDYNAATTSGRTHAGNDPQFQRWYNWAKTKGKPLAVVEFGRFENPKDANARAKDLLDTEAWLLSKNFFMFMYWQATGELDGKIVNWSIKDGPAKTAIREISKRGLR